MIALKLMINKCIRHLKSVNTSDFERISLPEDNGK